MKVFYTYLGGGRMLQSQSVGGEFEIHVTLVNAQDPFFAYKISKATFFQNLRGKNDRIDILEISFFDHFNELAGIGSLIRSSDAGNFSRYLDLRVINKCVAKDLLYCDDVSVLSLHFVAEAEFSCVYHRVYFKDEIR